MPKNQNLFQIQPGSKLGILGAPNIGKNTFVRSLNDLFSEELGLRDSFLHVDTGALIRGLGVKRHEDVMAVGGYVPDHDVIEIVSRKVEMDFVEELHLMQILNGTPRTPAQVVMSGINVLVWLTAHDKTAHDRFVGSLSDEERKGRLDTNIAAFHRRLKTHRGYEPHVVSHARRNGIPVIKVPVDRGFTTVRAAERFFKNHVMEGFKSHCRQLVGKHPHDGGYVD